MRKLEQLCAATVLTIALSVTAFAGIMDTPAASSPPPQPQSSTPGTIDTSGVILSESPKSETEATASVTVLTFYLFDSMMFSIF